MSQINVTGRLDVDYLATYDHSTAKITRLELVNFPTTRTLGVHGMDVVPSSGKGLFVYLVNHRVPVNGQDPAKSGVDSVIEIFEGAVGSSKLKHLRTVEHPAILTPNDVVGSADGKSFYFTNDHSVKTPGFVCIQVTTSPPTS